MLTIFQISIPTEVLIMKTLVTLSFLCHLIIWHHLGEASYVHMPGLPEDCYSLEGDFNLGVFVPVHNYRFAVHISQG